MECYKWNQKFEALERSLYNNGGTLTSDLELDFTRLYDDSTGSEYRSCEIKGLMDRFKICRWDNFNKNIPKIGFISMG